MKNLRINDLLILLITIVVSACGSGGGDPGGATGQGGSTMEFAIRGDMLYLISGPILETLDITDPSEPLQASQVVVGEDIETLFPYDGFLYIGSETGVYLYDLANPEVPSYVSEVTHLRSCDPVVAEGSLAYVTLRSTSLGRCRGTTNQLEIVDFSDPGQPKVIARHQMTAPHGLAIADDFLFICDGAGGLKMLNTDGNGQVLEIDSKAIECQDVIAEDGLLIATSKTIGIVQYAYDGEGLSFVSLIPVNDVH